MTLPRGYKPPKAKEISGNKDFLDIGDNTTNKKENSLTNEKLQNITINEIIDKGKEVVANIEEQLKKL
ncbi:MAG TPA: hypothetical protein VJ697_06260 [Nitrososphaeraceae archaeon]|nr:hypothetical protein [Nitrososphaeraceae archaeon]